MNILKLNHTEYYVLNSAFKCKEKNEDFKPKDEHFKIARVLDIRELLSYDTKTQSYRITVLGELTLADSVQHPEEEILDFTKIDNYDIDQY